MSGICISSKITAGETGIDFSRNVSADEWSQVTIDQKREEKKSGIEVHPFVEGYGFAESDKRTGAGAKAGVRVDF